MPENISKPQSIQTGDIKDSTVSITLVFNEGYTKVEHERILKERVAEIRLDLERAHESDKAVLVHQLKAALEELSELENSYKIRLANLQAQLIEFQKLHDQLPTKAFDEAQAALINGNTKLADNLYAEIENKESVTVSKAVFQRGRIAYEDIRWLDAIKHFKKAHNLAPLNINYMGWLAYLYEKIGDYYQARVSYEAAVIALTESADYPYNDLAKLKNSLARMYDLLDQPVEAEKLFIEAIYLFTQVSSADSVDLTNAYNNLAQLYCKNANYPEAENLYLIIIDIIKNLHGEYNNDLATVYSNLGNVYSSQKRYAESKDLFLRAIEIHKISSNTRSSNLGSAYNNLAYFYLELSDYHNAETYIKLAIEFDEPIFGIHHPIMAIRYGNFARIYQAQGLNDLAETQYKKALDIRLKCLPNDHQELIINFSNLGDIYFAKKKYDDAEINYEEALLILKTRSELSTANGEVILKNYARCLEIQGKETEKLLKNYVETMIDK